MARGAVADSAPAYTRAPMSLTNAMPPHPRTQNGTRRAPRAALVSALIVLLAHTAWRAAIILGPGMGGPSASDEERFHLPVLESFAAQFPGIDLSSYKAAATPGHHLVLTLIGRIAPLSLEATRFVSGLPVSIMLALLVWWCARRIGAGRSVLLALPLACSPHTTAFATLVLPESTSWLLVVCMLCLACARRVWPALTVVSAFVLLACVGVRQITLWTAAPMVVAAWMSAGVSNDARVIPRTLWPIPEAKTRFVRAGLALALTLPAIGLLAWFVSMWGGLVPPPFQSVEAAQEVRGVVNEGLSPAAPAFILSLLGIAGGFLSPLVLRPALERRSLVVRWAVIGGLAGLALALVAPTSYSMDDGRWGGIWKLAEKLPVVADRSLAITALSTFGGATTGVLIVALTPTRVRWVLLSAIGAVMAAHVAGAQLFQRYVEPLVLIVLPIAIACVYEERDDRPPAWTWLGVLALCGALLALTLPRLGA